MTDSNSTGTDGSAKPVELLLPPIPIPKLMPMAEEKLDAGLRSKDHCKRTLHPLISRTRL